MAWLLKDPRGPAWKHEWTRRTLASMSLPPFPLVAIFVIIILLLSVSSFMSYKNRMQHTLINLKLLLLFLPVLLIFLAMFASKYGSADNRNWNLPWGLAVSSFQSMWSPIVWRSN
ncbi:ER lumen protein retaining receptor [Salix suchowensis]|nr:ER lumen protein retaining receptor [Salix suchowensis]